jgi:homoserine O-acetyltransferase
MMIGIFLVHRHWAGEKKVAVLVSGGVGDMPFLNPLEWDAAQQDSIMARATTTGNRRCRTLVLPSRLRRRSFSLSPPHAMGRARVTAATLAALCLAGTGTRLPARTLSAAHSARADTLPTSVRAALLRDPANSEFTRPAPAVSRLRFETSRGVFVLELHRDWGPIGADRFYNLARIGYYDDTRFHRVRANYIAQWGLHGDSAVNAAWKGRYLRDDPPRSRNARGTFAFSYEGPGKENTRNTQVYVNLADNPRNDAEPFTVLGTVVEGMAVLDSLYSGYGEESGSGVRQGKQGPLERGGNAFMDREYPKLDRIVRVTVTP